MKRCAWIALLCAVANVASAAEELRLGVLAKRGQDEAVAQWQATADYLSERIPNHRFVVRAIDFKEFPAAVQRREIDFAISNSAMSVALEVEHGTYRIATLKNVHFGQTYTDFGGVIFARADSKFHALDDLRGRRFMAVDRTSLGGFLAAAREFHDHGIDVYRELQVSFGGTHDAVVYAVRAGKVEGGTVRTDALERMAAEGKIRLEEFRIINPQPGFPLRLSTRLYPEWPFTAMAHVDPALVQQVALALLQMPPESAAARVAQSTGWAVPGNYEPVHDLLKDLALPPYEFLGRITWHQVAYHNRPALYLSVLMVVLIVAYLLHVSVLNRRLARSGRELRTSLEQLERARQQLVQSEKMAAIGQLAAGVAHEINNPMGFIRGNLNSLRGYFDTLLHTAEYAAGLAPRLPAGDAERLALERNLAELDFLRDDIPQLIGESIDGADRVKRIVTDLRIFAADGLRHWETCDLNELIERRLRLEQPALEAKAELVRQLTPLPPVRCVAMEIEQVVAQLLNNAAQAIAGRGTITVRSGMAAPDRVWFEVQDTGSGIDAEHLSRIFDPFFTTRAPGQGVGLGLAVAYKVVQNHGGEIQVTSQPGQGATFRVVLPVAGPAGA